MHSCRRETRAALTLCFDIHTNILLQNVKDMERVCREIHVLKNIRHPNIIQLYARSSRCATGLS
jgi:hypothetical protein